MPATLQASAVVSAVVDETPVEAHLRRVLDTQPVPLSRVSVDGIFLAVNDAALSMLGAERLEQVLDTSLLDMVAPVSRESCRVFLSRVAAGDRGSTEVEFTGLGGLAHILRLHATTHPVSPDGTSSVLVTLRDITEHRRLEHAVVEAAAREERRAAAHAAEVARLSTQIAESHANAERKHHDAAERHAVLKAQTRAEVQAAQEQLEATIADHLSRLTEVEGALRAAEARERKMVEQHEATLAEARTREHDLIAAHSRNEAEWRRSLDEAIATHESNTSELRATVDSLKESLLEAQTRPGDEARIAELEQQLADVERKHHDAAERHAQAEQAAAAHQQQVGELRAAIAGLETSVSALTQQVETAVADRNAVLNEHKEALHNLGTLARERDAALAANEEEKRSLAAEHGRARAEWEREHQQALGQWETEHQQLQAKWAVERDELNSELVMVRHDRLAWSARLEHAERLARAGRLSLSFADDIATALEGVAAYGRLLMPDAGQGLHRDSLHQMLAAATAAQSLVRRLRHGVRTVEVDPVEISPVIHSLESTLAGLLSPNITLRILSGAEGARVGLTSQQIEQVALMLAANRRAAMVKGGQVTIELANVDIDEGCGRERMVSPGPYVLLAVHAAGPEVEHGIAPQLFGIPANEDMWQTAGPGMAGVFSVVNEWGGCLWASQQGPDALAFEIYLPRVMAGCDASAAGVQP